MNPLISVIIPAYAHAHFIGEAIRSVINQSFTDWELIIINDGSPDNTREAVTPFLLDSRIQYLEQDNQGQSAARNFGISVAKGEFIHLLDDDDWLPPDALEWQLLTLTTSTDVAVIVGAVTYVSETSTTVAKPLIKEGRLFFRDLFGGNAYASPGQALFRRSVFEEVGLFDVSLPGVDDYDMMFRVALSHHVLSTNRNALFYRCHPTNASANRARMLEDCLKIVNRYLVSFPTGRERRQAKRTGMRFLYDYAGSVLLANAISRTKPLKNVDQKPVSMVLANHFGLAMLVDPILLKKIFLDILRLVKRRLFPATGKLLRPGNKP